MLWALIFIFAIGLGPFAGALALAVHTAGVLGRLYSEALEEVPTGALWAIRASGGKHFGATLFAVLPQAFPQLLAYTLYRWEVNIRASAILGVVGAGGLGAALHISLSLFHHHRTLTLIGVIFLMVTLVDLLSSWLRRRVAAGPKSAVLRHELTGAIEAEIDDRRLVILELSMRGAQVFARAGELAGNPGTRMTVRLVTGPQRPPIACQAHVAWRRDELVGSFVGLTFDQLGLVGSWKLFRLLRRMPMGGGVGQAQPEVVGGWW